MAGCVSKNSYICFRRTGYIWGYDFLWYLRGPYCTGLATCGFALKDIYHDIPEDVEAWFANPSDQLNFEKFLKFVRGKEEDAIYLEIAASIHVLKKAGMDESGIIDRIMAKTKSFTRDDCERTWDDLIEHNLLPPRGADT